MERTGAAVTDRIPLDELTSDQYDALYAQLDRLSLTVDEYATGARLLSDSLTWRQRAEQAETAIVRVRALHTPVQHLGRSWCGACSVRRTTSLRTADDEWAVLIPHPCPTLDELDGAEQAPAATEATDTEPAMVTDPAYLTWLYTRAIRAAACNGCCKLTEEACAEQHILADVWHQGELVEVSGRPETLAAVVAGVRDRYVQQLQQRLNLADAGTDPKEQP